VVYIGHGGNQTHVGGFNSLMPTVVIRVQL